MGRASVRYVWRWLYPTLALLVAPLLLFSAVYTLDAWRSGGDLLSAFGVLSTYAHFDSSSAGDAGASLSGIVAAILGIVITVVSIIVQLAANRFSGITRMFLADRINQSVLAYYIISCILAVWLGPAIHEARVPTLTFLLALGLTTVGIVLVVPYFGYVFRFVDPLNIVSRIRDSASNSAKAGAAQKDPHLCFTCQAAVIDALEQLSDICSNSISGKDKIIASAAVDALKDFAIVHVQSKPNAVPGWSRVGPTIRGNPDFVAMAEDSLAELELRATWVEWKVLRHFLGIYNEALASMRDINYLIAIDTRYLGEAAVTARDRELLALVLRFFNSYLRTTLNARDVRTAYNVLNQYRLLVESMLRNELEAEALVAARHLRYYGQLGYELKLMFVTETVAYDIARLCEVAAQLNSAAHAELLTDFLQLDQPLDSEAHERALLGVRKAQAKLACFYLEQSRIGEARRIYEDMRQEPQARLLTIQQQLASVTTKDFWEITDRGRNFEFMPPTQRAQLAEFFGWFQTCEATQSAVADGIEP